MLTLNALNLAEPQPPPYLRRLLAALEAPNIVTKISAKALRDKEVVARRSSSFDAPIVKMSEVRASSLWAARSSGRLSPTATVRASSSTGDWGQWMKEWMDGCIRLKSLNRVAACATWPLCKPLSIHQLCFFQYATAIHSPRQKETAHSKFPLDVFVEELFADQNESREPGVF